MLVAKIQDIAFLILIMLCFLHAINSTNVYAIYYAAKSKQASPTYNTFLASGTISSLNFLNNNSTNIATSSKVILSGNWNINTNNGTIVYFDADFIAAPSDGSTSHTHQLVNLKGNDTSKAMLLADGSTHINGTVDVKINGITYWRDVHTQIIIAKGSTLSIILDDNQTMHHFMKQPIYGLVNRLMY